MRGNALICCVVTLLVVTVGRTAQPSKVRVVDYQGLKQAVLEQRGRVVLVNFWGTFCAPCKKKFPRWNKLQQELGNKLVVITVSLDKAAQKGRVAGFLAKHNPAFRNLLLDESSDVLDDKLRISTVPCYYVFDQAGRWTQFGGEAGDFDYKDVDALIRRCVQLE